MNSEERILEICKIVPALEDLFNAQVRHYRIRTHTVNVLNQYEKYFAGSFCTIEVETFRLFLILHDVGKAIAHKNRNVKNQNAETIRIVFQIRNRLNLTDESFILFKALLSADSLGLYMQNKLSLKETYSNICGQIQQSRLDQDSFLYLLSVYYQCDVASYTKDAGGFPFLEFLFAYEDGIKIYDNQLRLLKFSPVYYSRYIALLRSFSRGTYNKG